MGNSSGPCGRNPNLPKPQPIVEETRIDRPPPPSDRCCCRRRKNEYQQLDDGRRENNAPCCVCCGCMIFLLLIVFLVVPAVGGYSLVEKHSRWAEQVYADCPGYPKTVCTAEDGKLLTPENLTRYIAWNGCKQGRKDDIALAACAAPCISAEFISTVDTYNFQHPFTLVEFSSRHGPDGQKPALLKAWWMPSGVENAPRVVLQHGNNANFNSRMVVLASYLLRSIGIDVLIPSLRSHGLSAIGFDKTTWSYEYTFDTLGAWDYAVNDPDGVLGGSRPPSKVGLMGFSMGAYLVTSALGIEANVPAIWADSGVWTVNGMAQVSLAPYVGPLAIVLAPITILFSKLWTGVDITKYSPPEVLPRGPDTKRKVAVISSTSDNFVPSEETMKLADFVESNPTKYELVLKFEVPTSCNGKAHCSVEFVHPSKYRKQLWLFWDQVFKMSASGITFSPLPSSTRRLQSGTENNVNIEPAHVVV